jgi:DNA-binding IclR family transcriptional regulator
MGKILVAALPESQLQLYMATHPLTRLTPRTITSRVDWMSHLDRVRKRGFAVDSEEHRGGICCVGAPVRAHRGETVAAVSVSGPAFRMHGDKIPAFARLVMDAATAISSALGYRAEG